MNPAEFEQRLRDEGVVFIGTTPGPTVDPRIYPIDPEAFIHNSKFLYENCVFKRATTSSTTYYGVFYSKTYTTSIASGTGKIFFIFDRNNGGNPMANTIAKKPAPAAQAPAQNTNALAPIADWLDVHHTTRKFLNALIIFTVGWMATNQTEITGALPAWASVVAGAVIFAAVNWAKYNVNTQ